MGIDGRKTINVVAFSSEYEKEGTPYPDEKWVKEVPQEEVINEFTEFGPDAQALVKVSAVSVTSNWSRLISPYSVNG